MTQTLFIGITASVFSAISLLPQLIKLLKEKEAENISMPMLVILFLGLSCWIYYGILQQDWIIITSNIFSVLLNLLVIIFTIKYRKKAGTYKEFFS
ncbi:MAG: SemiSWEET transporter [Chitinophagaceae bacterium]